MKNSTPISRRKYLRFFLGLIAGMVLYFSIQQVRAQDNNSLLWEISGNGLAQPSYLFGTYHLIKSGSLPEDGKVLRAFNAADGVAVETELDPEKMAEAMTYVSMTDNSLSELLTEEEFALVDQELQASFGQPLMAMNQLKPASVSLYMAMAYVNEIAPELATTPGEALDKFFVEHGRANGKSIHLFETLLGQMELLYNSNTVEEQADMLVEAVEEKELGKRMGRDLLRNYQSENLDEMAKLIDTWEDAFGGMEELLVTRNKNWMLQMPDLLGKGNQFIAVGALHLPGPYGLLSLLQDQGYTVTPVH